MPHDVSLIATIAAGFGLAMLFGLLAARLRMPPLVGYLLAGVMIGPATPGFVADISLAGQLAEIGVMLLMFGVGLHFSLADLMAVRASPCPARSCRSPWPPRWAWAAMLVGLEPGAALVFGLCLSVASTVVLLRALEAKGLLSRSTARSRSAGWWSRTWRWCWCWCCCRRWPGLLGGRGWAPAAARRGGHLAAPSGSRWPRSTAFVALMLVVGRRVLPLAAVAGGPHRLARAVHAVRWWRSRWASPSARPSCSACRSRWAPSSPA
jgi:CPA2 family monovalent cation:H+ antiporter-2